MSNKVNKNSLILLLLYILVGLYFLFKIRMDFSEEERSLFTLLFITYVVTGGLIVIAKVNYGLDIFEPLTIVSLLYTLIFVYRPILDLYNDEVVIWGVNVINGGVKATTLYLLGFLCLYLGYYGRVRSSKSIVEMEPLQETEVNEYVKTTNQMFLVFMWGIVFIMCIVAMVSTGVSLRYIISAGTEGEVNRGEGTGLLFLANFGATLITLWLLIVARHKSKLVKIIVTFFTVLYIIMRNSRWLMLVFAVAPATYYYLKSKRRPKILPTIVAGIILLAIFAWMQINRPSLAYGKGMIGWGAGGFTLEKLFSPFDSDFTAYKAFYGVVNAYPSRAPFVYGKSFLYTIILAVPRVIWPSKPVNPMGDIIGVSINKLASITGTAVANLGEFYINFGVVGIPICMFLFGMLLRKLKYSLYTSDDDNNLVAYSILFPLLFQWVARGNFAGNFYLTLFAVLPFFFKKLI